MIQVLAENIEVRQVFKDLDIGGTNSAAIAGGTAAENHWVDITGYHDVMFVIFLGHGGGSWAAGDSIATITVEQATTSTGAGRKVVPLAGAPAGVFSPADGVLDASGDRAYVTVRANDIDANNAFDHVRINIAAVDNTNVDNVTVIAILYNPRFQKSIPEAIEYLSHRN